LQTKQLTLSLLVILATVLTTAVLIFTKPVKEPELKKAEAVAVPVISLAVQDIQPVVSVTGRLQPAHKASLKFEVSGRLARRNTEPGRLVNAGDILLELDKADYESAAVQARAKYDMEVASVKRDQRLLKIAGNDYALQQKEVQRLKGLGSKSLVSGSRLDQARQRLLQLDAETARLEYQVNTANSRLAVSKAARDLAERQLARTQLVAPYNGTINEVTVQEGDFINLNQKVIGIIDISSMDLYIEVAGNVVAALSLGTGVNVDISAKTYQGEVIALQNDPNPNTFTHAVRIRLSDAGLLPGQLARVKLPLTPLENVFVVPASALLREEGRNYVFALRQQSLQRIPVQLGVRYADGWVVSGDLQEQEQLVSRDVAALTDGQKAVVAQ